MRLFSRENLKRAFNALVVTMAFAAMFHLLLVSVAALIKHSMSYLNPLDFLGISILLPQYRDSTVVAAVGWLILSALFFFILYMRLHYHVYVAVVRESRLGVQITTTTRKLRKKIAQNLPHRSGNPHKRAKR